MDDEVLKPVQLVGKYAGPGHVPAYDLDKYQPHIAQLAGLTRLHVTSRIYQGVPPSQMN
ncbi:hypothetical protein [Hymenobacter rigui]|uniref:hypothetical protein n=1 Tax=Hymenobacter rigui TaxID=334424 RepID=UPI0014777A82|nr:hypothetical protein [Hymenobacter rigui]